MSIFDLHMHSCYSSDGELTPKQLVTRLKENGIKVAALSDHDCMFGIKEMIQEGNKEGIQIIPAIEFNTSLDGTDVHLLGYNFDYEQPYFQELDAHMRSLQANVLQDRIAFFKSYYQIEFDEHEILKDIGNANAYNAIVEAMLFDPRNKDIEAFQPYLEGGSRSDSPVPNFYWDTCSKGKPGFFPIPQPSFKKTVDLIHEHGGIAVIAHPWKNFYNNESLLEKAIAYGLDGLEAYSNYHNAQENEYYDALCKKYNLVMTCGSDFHGRVKPNIDLGEYGCTKNDEEEVLAAFLQALEKRETK